jgi:hypothetical protein
MGCYFPKTQALILLFQLEVLSMPALQEQTQQPYPFYTWSHKK